MAYDLDIIKFVGTANVKYHLSVSYQLSYHSLIEELTKIVLYLKHHSSVVTKIYRDQLISSSNSLYMCNM